MIAMPSLRRSYWLTLAAGLIAGGLLFALPLEYCVAGNGYGLPFPWYHPNHGEPGEMPVGEGDMAVDTPNLLSAAALWCFTVAMMAVRDRRASRERRGTDESWPPRLGQ